MKTQAWMIHFFCLFIFWSTNSAAYQVVDNVAQAQSTQGIDDTQISKTLQIGDVILISLNCYICTVIENETNSQYSHSAIVVSLQNGQIKVAQALGEVHELSLERFLKQSRKNSEWAVYRIKGGLSNDQKNALTKYYVNKFSGLGFDDYYLWNNFDQNGKELLYCSEFVTKLLNQVLANPIEPQVLDFKKNWEFWNRYYGGQVPQGQLGNSPAAFTSEFYFTLVFTSSR